jgi:hypothetical protein
MRYRLCNWTQDEFLHQLTSEQVIDYIVAHNGAMIDVAPQYERIAA